MLRHPLAFAYAMRALGLPESPNSVGNTIGALLRQQVVEGLSRKGLASSQSCKQRTMITPARTKGETMSKILSCRDVGVDCDFVAKGDTEEEILEQCAEHARNDHGMTEIPDDLVQKVRWAIRDEAA
jgi:predicted small metal-binding protein